MQRVSGYVLLCVSSRQNKMKKHVCMNVKEPERMLERHKKKNNMNSIQYNSDIIIYYCFGD